MGFQTVNGAVIFDSQTITTVSGNNNNVSISSTSVLIDTANDLDVLTGAVGAHADGEFFWPLNVSSTNTLVIAHDDANSDAGNRFFMPDNANLYLPPYYQGTFRYETQGGRTGWWSYTPGNVAAPIRSIGTVTVAGAAAGDLTVTGIAVGDQLSGVILLPTGTDLTAEFTITGTNTINNTGGTNTTGSQVLVVWADITP